MDGMRLARHSTVGKTIGRSNKNCHLVRVSKHDIAYPCAMSVVCKR